MVNLEPVRESEIRRRFLVEYEVREMRRKEEEARRLREEEQQEESFARVRRRIQNDNDNMTSNHIINENRDPPESTERPICRICFDGEDSGRLFSPCLCRGSVGQVHIDCLNSWRSMSSNPLSFYKCDQCGYKYNVKRADFATLLESNLIVQTATILIIVGVILFCASLAHVTGLNLADRFYSLVFWRPWWKLWRKGPEVYSWGWWRLAVWLDWTVGGGLIMGLVGFVAQCINKLRSNPDYFYKAVLPALLVTCLQHGAPVCRIFAVLGIAVAYQYIFERVHFLAKCVMLRFGEKILEVSPE
mmetsp:Transcript_32155/g.44589  ORF Transcript_32155/g.44589 Transcript_32155/m.44589 type:complete len:302 (+) Transcript_32155:136-1041(+)